CCWHIHLLTHLDSGLWVLRHAGYSLDRLLWLIRICLGVIVIIVELCSNALLPALGKGQVCRLGSRLSCILAGPHEGDWVTLHERHDTAPHAELTMGRHRLIWTLRAHARRLVLIIVVPAGSMLVRLAVAEEGRCLDQMVRRLF